MDNNLLAKTASLLVAPGKGILAADESLPTIEKRFAAINLESTEESRRAYRELLFTTPGIEEFISGIILFKETVSQKNQDKLLIDVIKDKGIIPGIKMDEGSEDFAGHPGEKVSLGADALKERLTGFKDLGFGFSKWRVVFSIGAGLPSDELIERNVNDLTAFAAISQELGFVPVVEPEVLMEGSHSINACEKVTTQVLEKLFAKLMEAKVDLSGLLLKPNMVIPGKDCSEKATAQEIAEATIRTLKNSVPSSVPGIVFLSGGQSPHEATEYLNEMNKISGNLPWQLSFSFGRALQEPILKAWEGKAENVDLAQNAFYQRAKLNSLARNGKYERGMENG